MRKTTLASDKVEEVIAYVRANFHQLDLPAPPDFSELAYLQAHPDVEEIVRLGKMRSGYHHWIIYGRFEGRSKGGIK